ncbi:MAG: hypothetical protein ACE5MH_05345 [Terriglobia bacterium]
MAEATAASFGFIACLPQAGDGILGRGPRQRPDESGVNLFSFLFIEWK